MRYFLLKYEHEILLAKFLGVDRAVGQWMLNCSFAHDQSKSRKYRIHLNILLALLGANWCFDRGLEGMSLDDAPSVVHKGKKYSLLKPKIDLIIDSDLVPAREGATWEEGTGTFILGKDVLLGPRSQLTLNLTSDAEPDRIVYEQRGQETMTLLAQEIIEKLRG